MAKRQTAPAQPTTQDDELPETAVSKRAEQINKGLLSQQNLQQAANQPEPSDEPPASTPEEETWKKRHGDLRRYTQQKEDEFKTEIAGLQSQVNQLSAMASQPMSKTKEEFDAFVKKYPDIVVFIEMIADMKASERTSALQAELNGVKNTLHQTKEEKDLAILESLVPDYVEILSSDQFAVWKEGQPQYIINVLDHSENPKDIADVFIRFRRDTQPAQRQPQGRKLDALDTGVKNTGSTPSKTGGSHKFTTRQIKNMSSKEFEANEAAIEDARGKGLILNDM